MQHPNLNMLCRAQKVNDRECVEGYYVYKRDMFASAADKHFIVTFQSGESFEWYKIDPSTLNRCTGRQATNGKKIFFGDKVRCYGGEYYAGYYEYDKTFVADNTDCNSLIFLSEAEYVDIVENKEE